MDFWERVRKKQGYNADSEAPLPETSNSLGDLYQQDQEQRSQTLNPLTSNHEGYAYRTIRIGNYSTPISPSIRDSCDEAPRPQPVIKSQEKADHEGDDIERRIVSSTERKTFGQVPERRSLQPGNKTNSHEQKGPRQRLVSPMRWFLDSHARFQWPSEVGIVNGEHCDSIRRAPIPLTWLRKLSKQKPSIDVYEGDGRYSFRKPFMVKTVRFSTFNKSSMEADHRDECSELKSLRHPHCVAFLGSFSNWSSLSILIFPAAQYSLHQLMQNVSEAATQQRTSSVGAVPESWKNESRDGVNILRRCFLCLAQGLNYLHESGITSIRIQPASILVDFTGSILLADFGISTANKWEPNAKYFSPEFPLSESSQIFSLGCVLLEAATLVLDHDLDFADLARGRLPPGHPPSRELVVLSEKCIRVIDCIWRADSYCKNIRKVYVWLETLENCSSKIHLLVHPSERSAREMMAVLPTIGQMLAEDPGERPKANGLWEDFKHVSQEVCSDCDPRHPNVWEPDPPGTIYIPIPRETTMHQPSSTKAFYPALGLDRALLETPQEVSKSASPHRTLLSKSVGTSDFEELPVEMSTDSNPTDGASNEISRQPSNSESSALSKLESTSTEAREIQQTPSETDTDTDSNTPIDCKHMVTEDMRTDFSSFVRRYSDMIFKASQNAAEFLELREKQLKPGLRRIRWTCVCGARLYDDFQEISVGSLAELHNFLNNRPGVYQSTNGTSASRDATLSRNTAVTNTNQSVQSFQTALTERPSDNSNLTEGLRRRGRGSNLAREEEPTASKAWVLPIFQYDRYATKVKHVAVDSNMSDEALFISVKKHYLEETSRLRRFFSLRGVKKISCVKFIHAPREPDIHKFDDWPLQKHSPPWIYRGCPAKKKQIPLVGHTYLMHAWQNPSHSDMQTYQMRNPGNLQKLLRYLRLARPVKQGATPIAGVIDRAAVDPEQATELAIMSGSATRTISPFPPSESQGSHSSYVFLRTPKKVGDPLLPDDEDPPEAWGLYFEEGFRVHHFFMVILFFYILASLAFAVYWCSKYGLVGPQSGAEAFGVSSWMIALVSLVVTVWFKWAD